MCSNCSCCRIYSALPSKVTSWIANDAGHNQSVDVSYFAQTPDGQRRNRNTKSIRHRKAFGLHFKTLLNRNPIRVSVVSLRNISGDTNQGCCVPASSSAEL